MKRAVHGFHLLELLVVMAIIGLLAVLIVPSFNSIVASSNLSMAGQLVSSQLELARQSAVTFNRPVEVRFYQLAGEGENGMRFRAVRVYLQESPTSPPRPLTRLERLPQGVVFDDLSDRSTILSRLNPGPPSVSDREDLPGAPNTPFKSLTFLGSGAPSLDASSTWHLTIVPERSVSQPGLSANFVTLQVEPFTGRVMEFRP